MRDAVRPKNSAHKSIEKKKNGPRNEVTLKYKIHSQNRKDLDPGALARRKDALPGLKATLIPENQCNVVDAQASPI